MAELNSRDFGLEAEGATPLSPDDYVALIPKTIRSRDDLNVAEALNILKAQTKFFESRLSVEVILDDLFVRRLHGEMFGEVWRWAGKYRTRNLNLGVDFSHVSERVRSLIDSAKFWLWDEGMDIDLLAVRLHHQLVLIHPFVNGNGRLSRLMADLLLTSLRSPEFSWGSSSLSDREVRHQYLSALKLADKGDIEPLVRFARS